jgi:hypothetical protein
MDKLTKPVVRLATKNTNNWFREMPLKITGTRGAWLQKKGYMNEFGTFAIRDIVLSSLKQFIKKV